MSTQGPTSTHSEDDGLMFHLEFDPKELREDSEEGQESDKPVDALTRPAAMPNSSSHQGESNRVPPGRFLPGYERHSLTTDRPTDQKRTAGNTLGEGAASVLKSASKSFEMLGDAHPYIGSPPKDTGNPPKVGQ